MSQITEPTKIVLDSVARGVIASVVIAFVWAVLFTIGIMTGWFAPWWLWIGLAVIIFMAVANMPDESAKRQEGPDELPPTDRNAGLLHAQPFAGQSERSDIKARLGEVEQRYDELNRCPAVVPVGEDRPPREPGVYVFLDDKPCYVGRTSDLRRRIQQHRDAHGATGHLPATIERLDGIPIDEARQRVRAMTVRWVVVTEAGDHGVCQALLELYAAVQLGTLATKKGRYNTFENH